MFYESQPLPQVHPFHLGVVVGVLVLLQPSGQRLDALAPHHEELRGKALGVEVQNTRLATRDDSMTPNRSRDGMVMNEVLQKWNLWNSGIGEDSEYLG